nr:ABC transporter G family member 28-like [Tanacetum cinerariifolium]
VTNICDPYRYQPPPGVNNHTCGGADVWSAVTNSREVFCPAGSYCPSSIEKHTCESGHYCRLGSTYETVLATREKRKAKSREAAALSAKEVAQERWRSAKDGAKKRAVGLQSSLTRTFSRMKSPLSEQSDIGLNGNSSKDNSMDQNNLTMMMSDLEENPESHDGYRVEIGDNISKKGTKQKKLHTRSQIFQYAYGQIEKEKALEQQKSNLSFSGVISMATDPNIRIRPRIEVSFKDLTITLKGKKKHL